MQNYLELNYQFQKLRLQFLSTREKQITQKQ